jgi:hypothetical protein
MTKYMVLRGYDPEMARLHGKKKTNLDRLIGLRSWLAHSELQFSSRYGGISFSATLKDGCKCARFKMIEYSHPERWRDVYIPVTEEQEKKIFEKCCEMADWIDPVKFNWDIGNWSQAAKGDMGCAFGPNALKYDTPAVALGFISKARFWKVRKDWVFCSMACAMALMEVWPELLDFRSDFRSKGYIKAFTGDVARPTKRQTLNPDQVHPALLDSICRCKFNERIEK